MYPVRISSRLGKPTIQVVASNKPVLIVRTDSHHTGAKPSVVVVLNDPVSIANATYFCVRAPDYCLVADIRYPGDTVYMNSVGSNLYGVNSIPDPDRGEGAYLLRVELYEATGMTVEDMHALAKFML